MWRIVNERTNKKIASEKCNMTLQMNNTVTSESKEVANIH